MNELNSKIDKILDSVWDEACDMMEDGGTADVSRGEAKKALLTLITEQVRLGKIQELKTLRIKISNDFIGGRLIERRLAQLSDTTLLEGEK